MPTPIEIEIEGKTYKGSYETDGHLLTTRYRMQAMTDEVRSTAFILPWYRADGI